ncbi:MAG: DUF3006 domain-containing protein [Bacillota bacterium]
MLIIDRFEGDKAVVESSGGTFEINKSEIPNNAKEGDVLKIIVDKEETSTRRQAIKELSKELFE